MNSNQKLGLGCMGMTMKNKDTSIQTIHTALENGVTLLNTGEFYGQGQSEMVVGEALKGIERDQYFLSVKFGVLSNPRGGIYGLDVEPSRIKAHLAYSLRRLGLDYVDFYQPARMDTEIPVEAIMEEMVSLKAAGHGLLTDRIFETGNKSASSSPMLSGENLANNIELVRAVKEPVSSR